MTLDLPQLGMGTAAIGNLYRAMPDAEAHAAVHAALDAGIHYFDTAPHYGFGLAEERLGAVIRGRGDVIVSTKVGRLLAPTEAKGERYGFVDARPFAPVFDYSHDAVLQSHEESLCRLHRDRVEILLAHDIGRLTHGEAHETMLAQFLDGGYRAMRRLRDEGAVDAIGIGVNEVAICLSLLERIELDVILLAGRHTLLDRSAAETLLPICEACVSSSGGRTIAASSPARSPMRPTSTTTIPRRPPQWWRRPARSRPRRSVLASRCRSPRFIFHSATLRSPA
jgi:D-threo-aldose 1-dehydrogenase